MIVLNQLDGGVAQAPGLDGDVAETELSREGSAPALASAHAFGSSFNVLDQPLFGSFLRALPGNVAALATTSALRVETGAGRQHMLAYNSTIRAGCLISRRSRLDFAVLRLQVVLVTAAVAQTQVCKILLDLFLVVLLVEALLDLVLVLGRVFFLVLLDVLLGGQRPRAGSLESLGPSHCQWRHISGLS